MALAGTSVSESQSVLGPSRRIVSMQRRGAGDGAVTETDGVTGERTETTLGGGWDYYHPRVAVASTGRLAAAFSDNSYVHLHVKDPGGPWREVGAMPSGYPGYSDGRPVLAFSPLGHLVLAWARRDVTGDGQRIWLSELAPEADELTPPRALDALGDPPVVQVPRDVAVSARGGVALAYLEGPVRTSALTARVAFGGQGTNLDERHSLPGIVTASSWGAPQVDLDAAGRAAIAWHTVPAGFDETAALGELHTVVRRADGTLGPIVDFGQTPSYDTFFLGVSDPGEILLGFQAAGNLQQDSQSWGYSIYGYKGALGSTVLERMGAPQQLYPNYGVPRFAMNRRGDALVAWDECCPDARGVVRFRRRVPGGTFGKPMLVATGDLVRAGENSYYGSYLQDADMDPTGNIMVSWSGFGPVPSGLNAAVSGPLLEVPFPGVPLGRELPLIVPASEMQLPAVPYPGIPVTTNISALSQPVASARVRTARPTPLALSVSAAVVHGVPRRLRLYVACDTKCSVRGSGRLAGLGIRLRRHVVKGGRVARMTIRLSPSVRRRARSRLRRARSATVRIRVVATTSAGARAESKLVVSLLRG